MSYWIYGGSKINRAFGFVSTLGSRFQTRRFYLPFCLACFLIALALGLIVTQSGPGIGSDSYLYMRAGENLYHGNGFHVNRYYFSNFESTGGPAYTKYPLYPLLIAAFMRLGLDMEQAARVVPILCFALLAFPLFFLGKTINDALTGYVACVMCLVFTPLLWLASWAWTEMPYILFSVLTILFLVKFAESRQAKTKILCLSAFFAALAILTRYPGFALLPVGLIVIVLKNRPRLRKESNFALRQTVHQTLLFGSISCLPVIPWLYRNLTLTSDITGYGSAVWQETGRGLFWTIDHTVKIIWGDFLAGPAQNLLSYLHVNAYVLSAITATCFILLAIYLRRCSSEKSVLLEYLKRNHVLFSYILLYLVPILILKSNYGYAIDSRRITPVYPFIILVGLSFVFYAYQQMKKRWLKQALFSGITILCVLFIASQATSTFAFYQSAKDGQGWNGSVFRESQGIAWIASNVSDNATLYSNDMNVIMLKLRRPVHNVPLSVAPRIYPPPGTEEAIERWVGNLEGKENVFIVCFKVGSRRLSNDEIAEINERHDVLVVLADFPDSTVWGVR